MGITIPKPTMTKNWMINRMISGRADGFFGAIGVFGPFVIFSVFGVLDGFGMAAPILG